MVHLVREIYHHNYSWKDIKLSELGELYLSMMIKTLGLSLIGIFIPVYLYQLGYGIDEIALFFMVLYGFRLVFDNLAARLVGYFGPKHMMILSHIFLIISLFLFLSLETIIWPLAFIAITDAIGSGLFFVAYHVEFSKLQSAKHSGHEIGMMYRLAKLAGAIGPLIGGIIATFYDVRLTIVLAIILILISAIPLLLSPEPVRRRQHVTFKGFPWKEVKWDIVANASLGVEQLSTIFIWPLYVSIFIFSENVYLSIGIISSLGLIASFVVSTIYGRHIDRGQGGVMLKLGVLGTSLTNIVRLFLTSTVGVYFFNLVSDPISIALRMPFTKGSYAAASSHEGYRNAYIGVVMTAINISRTITFVIVYFIATYGTDEAALKMIFLLAAVSIWGTRLHRFKALQ